MDYKIIRISYQTFQCADSLDVALSVRKVKVSLCLIEYHAMKTWGSGGITPLILNFGTTWK
jgi:hypothetical protein